MKIYILDNYDSFTFNLKHYFEALDCEVLVERNNEVRFNEIDLSDAIVLSPGPGLPKDAGKMMEVIEKYNSTKPILGVCLGHQALIEYFGGSIFNMDQVLHGKKQAIDHEGQSIFKDIPSPFNVGLYHSWATKSGNCVDIKTIAQSENKIEMAFEHLTLPIYGVQFHPESILTEHGMKIIENFISTVKH
jgi:anthranilate synthase component 2